MSADQTTAEHNALVAQGRRIQREAVEVWTAYQRLSEAGRILFTTMKMNHAMARPTLVDPVALAKMERYLG